MATNIDKLASQYIANGGKYTEDEIREACQKIQDNVTKWNKSSDSLFDLGSDFSNMSEDSFIQMMRNATSSGNDLDEYFSVLYDVMNSDGVDGLSRSEIDALFGTSGKDSISSFSIYHHMSLSSNLGEDPEDDADIDDSSDGDGTVTGDADDTTVDSGDTTVDGDDTTDVDGSSGDSSLTPYSTTSKPSDFADMSNWTKVADYIKAFLIDGNDEMDQPSEIIDYLLNNGTLSEEEADYARQALIYGSQDTDMQTRIRQWMENGDTFDEAIKKLGIDINESDLYKTAKELQKASGTSTGNSTSDVNIEAVVEQLYNSMEGMVGTDEDTLESILFDENISDEDFLAIVKMYEEKYGCLGENSSGIGLVTRIEKETSGSLQSKLTAQLAQRLVNAAEAGNEDAINMLCIEIYSGTVGQNCTANDFLETIFSDDVDDSIIAQIDANYNTAISSIKGSKSGNSKGSLYEDIRTEYNGILGIGTLFGRSYGSGSDMLSKILQAQRNCGSYYNN